MGCAESIWCAASAPPVQGMLVGLGLLSAGLAFFPWQVRLKRPDSGPMSEFAGALHLVRWTRRLSWLLVPLVATTLGGYIVIFVRTQGKFCDAVLAPPEEAMILAWGSAFAATTVVVGVGAVLRHQIERVNSRPRSLR